MESRMKAEMKQTRLVPWFGSDAMEAGRISKPLDGCSWVGIPFAGGMSIVPELKASCVAVNDKHRHVINLARVLVNCDDHYRFADELSREPFHPDVLADAQAHCRLMEHSPPDMDEEILRQWAKSYFIASWMGRSGNGGTDDEFKGKLSVRWSTTGGDSNVRYRSAVKSIDAWVAAMQRCNFTCLDFRAFLEKCKDIPTAGLYCDPPWVIDGDRYKHTFAESDHRDLARILSEFEQLHVVLRYGDHQLIRELYPSDSWDWSEATGRTAGNNPKAEVLIVRKA